ncbi:hypothetical protein [Sphingomonas hengshuiensis]|uniref:DUF3052 domain-containing protein n=1 Tax=Sphingomonas hengshuiensis TaxID=1609977 RepID=A0A7U4J918_9SPHN|nr:hypothetical protein [Sphingomonas hengshuiensis]AJP72481.1 hypothetical protein TS85_12845 [Sphingomonas hengshuiensis]
MSDKPVAERLQVKHGRRLAVIGAPPALDAAIGTDAPRAAPSEAEVVLLATPDRATFLAQVPRTAAAIAPAAILWVAYPKLTSPLAADLNRDTIRALALAHGLDTVSQIAVDADWSAMRLKRV